MGILANWTLRDLKAETSLSGLAVEKGEILDFVVDSRGDDESDGFSWAPVIEQILEAEEAGSKKKPRRWSAEDDFRGPEAKPLDPWEQYAQVLLETNRVRFCRLIANGSNPPPDYCGRAANCCAAWEWAWPPSVANRYWARPTLLAPPSRPP